MKRILQLAFAMIFLISAIPISGFAQAVDTTPNNAADFTSYTPDELYQQWMQIGTLLRANGAYPFVELEKGNTGYEVVALQTRLAALGYYQKEIVDYFGNGTYNGMRAFEKDYGLTVDGIASVTDQQLLFSNTPTAVTPSIIAAPKSSTPDAVSAATAEEP